MKYVTANSQNLFCLTASIRLLVLYYIGLKLVIRTGGNSEPPGGLSPLHRAAFSLFSLMDV